jgi:CDGSH-type Zn-finger protein
MEFLEETKEIINNSGVEITIDDMIDSVRTRTSNLNKREIDHGNWFLDEKQKSILQRKWQSDNDFYCDNCHKTKNILILEWQHKQLSNEIRGLPRQERKVKSWFVVNELSGRGLHTYVKLENGNLMQRAFGNINRLCRACNYLYHTHKHHLPHNENTPQSVIISHDLRGGYEKMVINLLTSERHVCKIATFNKISGKLGGTQATMESAYKQKHDILWETINIEDYHEIKCHYKFCDGEHIIRKGYPPERILTNKEAEEKEIREETQKKLDLEHNY